MSTKFKLEYGMKSKEKLVYWLKPENPPVVSWGKYARVKSRNIKVWNWFTTFHILWGEDKVNIEDPTAAAAPTPAAIVDAVPATLPAVDVCWVVATVEDEVELEPEFEVELELEVDPEVQVLQNNMQKSDPCEK